MPPAVLASAAEVSIVHDGGAHELERLRREFGATKLLLVANLVHHNLWASGLLGSEVRTQLQRRFPYVSGSWCCAPEVDKKRGMPNSHSFHLPIPKPDWRPEPSDKAPLDGEQEGGDEVVEG